MSQHARPHLQTHSRSDGHSAVAGAAYRLGLRLVDERTGLCYDFRKRKLGEEIVRALTVAPPGSPAWATAPAQLWNRVELAEKRKDSQIARDYRIPIPLGLTDEQAGNLAEEMARFIADELHTPVSVGLHRDADRDVLGVVKPDDRQGFMPIYIFRPAGWPMKSATRVRTVRAVRKAQALVPSCRCYRTSEHRLLSLKA